MVDFPHIPVLLEEMFQTLAPKAGGVYVDGTFGAGGYTQRILSVPGTRVFAIDRDGSALSQGKARLAAFGDRVTLLSGCFSEMTSLLAAKGISSVDGVVLDLGVSSMHLDQAERGFSFRNNGPLDMRMGHCSLSAAEVVNTFSQDDLADLLYSLGEEKKARAIARAIVSRRASAPFETTHALADCVVEVYGGPRVLNVLRKHPATQTFQALRIFVNNELEELQKGLEAALELVHQGGRLVVVTFHSLEDRIVKQRFRLACGRLPNPSRFEPFVKQTEPPAFKDLLPGGCPASESECAQNPRARSARMRAVLRL